MESNNSNVVLGLVIGVVALVVLPIIFILVRQHNWHHPEHGHEVIIQRQVEVVRPVNLYSRGYDDAMHGRGPSCHDHDYIIGYREYCHKHPGCGLEFRFDIRD